MPQFARPNQDVVAWASGSFASIDEVAVDDNDFVQSDSNPNNDPYVTKLSSVTDPVSSSGHVVRYRIQKPFGSAQVDLTVQLRQGYVSEGAQGTLIASWSHTNVPGGFVTWVRSLSGAEADAITDYASLYLRFVADQI